MSKIQETLETEAGFVGYLTAGDGGIDRSKAAMQALIEGGVNILEIGVPFSDPVADGTTIQDAAQRALDAGTSLDDILKLVCDLRKETDIPIILFSYYNPIFQAGSDFFKRAVKAGVNGCLIVDLPIEESEAHCETCKAAGIDPVFLISPSTPIERVKKINHISKGMLYYVCRTGTTGVKDTFPKGLKERLAEIKSVTTLPLVAGFGISKKEMAAAVLQHADGFVVGSLFVKAVADGKTTETITALARSIDPR